MASVIVHFDGTITVDHKVSIRVLANTYEHMQRAIDRAYLINTYGEVWKHARLTGEQYQETDFIAEYPREGGIILDAVRNGANRIIDRVYASIRPVFDSAVQQGLVQHQTIAAQHAERSRYVEARQRNIQTFEDLRQTSHPEWAAAYSNRSVVKEIDQLVGQIVPARLDGSSVDLSLRGSLTHPPLAFDSQRAKRFHQIASQRELAAPVRVMVKIRSLDRGNDNAKPGAKILNLSTDREVTLQLSSRQDFDALHPHHNGEPVELYVSPIVESLGFDLNGGDLMFIAVA